METRQKLEDELKEAMRSGDTLRKQNIRMVMSAIKLTEIEKGTPLDEAGVIAIIQKELKSRQEALQEAQKANRPDLEANARNEMAFLESFLPQQFTPDELSALVQETVQEVNASGPADMGKVMKALMPKLQGRATGNQVSQAVREQLQK